MAMSEREIMALWERVTGYDLDWESVISDLLDELDSLSIAEGGPDEEDMYEAEEGSYSISELRDALVSLRHRINQAVEGALADKVLPTELESVFAEASDALMRIEEEVFRIRELSEFDIYDYEERFQEDEEEE